MPDISLDTDVLIVGAGPVGLFLANECARRGLRFRIIEARASQSEHSKALAIFPRTLEIFDMAGIVAPFLEVANRVTSVAVIAHKHRLAHMPFTPDETPYPFVAMVPQDVTERLLAEQLMRRGGAVEYETSFFSADQHDGHVSVTLARNGQHEKMTAAFVVGCDGARSPVRHLLNLSFEGAEYPEHFLLADIETNEALPADQMQLCPHQHGPVAIFPMSATRRRIVAMVDEPEGGAPTLEFVRQLLVERAPAQIEARALHWSSYFRIHHRHVTQLRAKRIFVAGDAAHIHSPFGGQGMNTGLHDAWNLIWKLDLVLRGHGDESILDSYGTERLPVIRDVIRITDRLTKAMGTANWLAQTVRDAVIPMVSRIAPFQHAFVQRLSELDIAYRDGPLVVCSGKRFLDDTMRGGTGIRSRFLLFVDKQTNPALIEATQRLVRSLAEVVELRLGRYAGITLVRPDGYVAWSAHKTNDAATLAPVRSLLELGVPERQRMRSA